VHGLGRYLSLFRYRCARLAGVAARFIVIPLDYRPGTELASFEYHLPHTFAHSLLLYSLFSLSLSLSLSTLFTSKLRSFAAPFFTLANHPVFPPLRSSFFTVAQWLVKRVRGFLLFLIYRDRELGTIDVLSSNLHVSYHSCISPSYCNYARTGE